MDRRRRPCGARDCGHGAHLHAPQEGGHGGRDPRRHLRCRSSLAVRLALGAGLQRSDCRCVERLDRRCRRGGHLAVLGVRRSDAPASPGRRTRGEQTWNEGFGPRSICRGRALGAQRCGTSPGSAKVRPVKEPGTAGEDSRATRRVGVSKYLFLFGWRGETVAGFIKEPSDREAAMRELLQEAGGDLECLYFMFGQHDGLAIVELPDSSSAAAAAMSIAGTGAYSHFETDEIIWR